MIRKILKICMVRKLLSKMLFIFSNIVPKSTIPNKNEAINILNSNGFDFNDVFPTDSEFTELLPNEIDVSIVIPIYNAENFLRKCLDSVVNQETNYIYEVICVNDGSTDGSLDILNDYASLHPSIIKIINQDNGGISAARNRGIESARGRYVGFMDNDDYVSSNYIQECMKCAYKTDSDIVQTGIIEETTSGRTLLKTNKKDMLLEKVGVNDKPNLSGYVWDGVIRKSLFDKVRFPVGYWYEDMIMVLILFRLSNKVCIIQDHMYHKTIHDKNASKILWNSKNIKSLEKYWLAEYLSKYGEESLGLIDDNYLYHSLIYEFGTGLFFSIKGLSPLIKKATFSLCSSCLKQHKCNIQHTNKYHKKIEEAYDEGNYYKYVLTCLASRLS